MIKKNDNMQVIDEINSTIILVLGCIYLVGINCVIDYLTQNNSLPLGSDSWFYE